MTSAQLLRSQVSEFMTESCISLFECDLSEDCEHFLLFMSCFLVTAHFLKSSGTKKYNNTYKADLCEKIFPVWYLAVRYSWQDF